ncbi:MAG: hypothetical protein QOG62_812 [Thermoleophilaceae bacterium]|jgi:hypothetical protein|nr:hypothetical protein [Thermoleophilaceae bacterium]
MELNLANLLVFASAGIALAGYVAFILVPAVGSYDRMWERAAAAFLSLFILTSLVFIGLGVGLAVVYFYEGFG